MSFGLGCADELSEFSENNSHQLYRSPQNDYDDQADTWIDENFYHAQDESDQYCHDNTDDSDSEGEMGVRALAYDPNQLTNAGELPVNGHDYLKLVQDERQRLPAVVTAPRTAWNNQEKKSTQNSAIPMELVLHCDEEIGDNQENCMPSQQSSLYPMETSHVKELSPLSSSLSSSLSSDEYQLDNNHFNDNYPGMTSREIREQIRLKSIGCTPLNRNLNKRLACSPVVPSTATTDKDCLPRDQILANFLRLRLQIESIRSERSNLGGKNCDISLDGEDVEEDRQRKSGKRTDKPNSRSERRASNFLHIMNLGHPPALDTLVNKSQLDIHLTLEKLADQCEKAPMYSTLHADWIYSLMALLREPIEPDICSTLRRIAKLCMARRDSYERRLASSSASDGSGEQVVQDATGNSRHLVSAINDEEYYACLLLICIVRYHFGQADLK